MATDIISAGNATYTGPTRSGRCITRAADASHTAVIVLPDGGNSGIATLWSSPSPYTTWTKRGVSNDSGGTAVDHSHAIAVDSSNNALLAKMGNQTGADNTFDSATFASGPWGTLVNFPAVGNNFYGDNHDGGPSAITVTGNGNIWMMGCDETGTGYVPTSITNVVVGALSAFNSTVWYATADNNNAKIVAPQGSDTLGTPSATNSVDVAIAYDGSNNLYAFWLDANGNCRYGTWADGSTYPATPVATTLTTGVVGDALDVVRDSAGGIHVAVSKGASGIVYFYKPNGGAFSSAQTISGTGTADTYPVLCAFGSANILLAWQTNTGTNQNNLVYITAAISSSPAWSSSTAIYTDSGSVNARYLACEPQSADGTTVLFAWTDHTATPFHIWSLLVTPTFGGAAPPTVVLPQKHGQWPNAPMRTTQRVPLTMKEHTVGGFNQDHDTLAALEQFYGVGTQVSPVQQAHGQWPNAPLRTTQRVPLTTKTPGYNPTTTGVNDNDLTRGNVDQFYGVPSHPTTAITAMTLAGVGSLAPTTVTVTNALAATLAGVGSLAATVTVTNALSATLAGVGSLAPTTVTVTNALTATLAGVGSLSPTTVTVTNALTATLSGVGSLAATVTVTNALSATLAGVGSLAATVTVSSGVAVSATLAGVGSLAVVVTVTNALSATLAGVGSLSVVVTVTNALSPTLSGVGSLAATVTVTNALTATLSGVGSLAPTTVTVTNALSPTLSGVGSLAVTVTVTNALSATLAGVGALAAVVTVTNALTATLAGVGSLSATVSVSGAIAVVATLAGVGSLAAVVTVTNALTAALAGTGSLAVTVMVTNALTATLSGVGALAVVVTVTNALTVTLSGVGSLAAVVVPICSVAPGPLAGVGSLAVVVKVTNALVAVLTGVGSLVVVVTVTNALVVVLLGTGSLVAVVTISPTVVVLYIPTGATSMDGTITGGTVLGAVPTGATVLTP